jgi:hypothetical protein
MAYKADAFTRQNVEIDPVERPDGAEMLFDAVQLHECRARFSHGPR